MEIEENYNNIKSQNNNEKKEEEYIPSSGDRYIEICPKDFGSIRDACLKANFPLLKEFDFK